MGVKDELLYDFNVNLPKVLVNGPVCIVDNVKKLILISERSIVIASKKGFVSVNGHSLTIKEIDDERVQVIGGIETIEFFKALSGD